MRLSFHAMPKAADSEAYVILNGFVSATVEADVTISSRHSVSSKKPCLKRYHIGKPKQDAYQNDTDLLPESYQQGARFHYGST